MRSSLLPPLAALLTLAGSCATPDYTARAEVPVREASPWTEAAGDVAHPGLADLCRSLWEYRMESDPLRATRVGDPRYHGRLEAPTPERRTARARAVRKFLDRFEVIEATELGPEDRTTWFLIRDDLRVELEGLTLEVDAPSWTVDPLEGPQVSFLNLAPDQPSDTRRERLQLLERWRRIPSYIDQAGENLRRGVASGRTATRTAVEKTIAQLDAILATPPEASVLFETATGGASVRFDGSELHVTPAEGDALPAEDRAAFAREVFRVVREKIYPAFERYRGVLEGEVLPAARSDDLCGVVHLRGGERYYDWCIRSETTLELTPEEIHAAGLADVAKVRSEIAELGLRVLGTGDVLEIQEKLRGDPDMHFRSRQEVQDKAEATLARARSAMSAAFEIQPAARCEVVRIPAHEEKETTIAYYRRPSADGRRPGRYFINTYAPTTRPRYEAEVLAYHEAIPGHHLQLAIAQELEGLPLVRRHGGKTAFVEGWALYTERLAEEMGLYTSDLDRLGMLSFDAWRACRLVVDTGIHALGWTRDDAIRFMLENTLLAENNVVNEVDRYIAWPGQALAYKTGQREILALREQAKRALGDSFDLREFHDRVLENGGVTLAVLRMEIESWIEERSN